MVSILGAKIKPFIEKYFIVCLMYFRFCKNIRKSAYNGRNTNNEARSLPGLN